MAAAAEKDTSWGSTPIGSWVEGAGNTLAHSSYLWGDEKSAGVLGTGNYVAGANPTIGTTQEEELRKRQMQLGDQYQAQISGQGPSLAQMQLQQGTAQNIAQAMALGQSTGQNNPGQVRNIMNQQAAAQQQMVGQSGQLRLQEQMGAENQYSQMLGGARQQDVGLAQAQAQLEQQKNDAAEKAYMDNTKNKSGLMGGIAGALGALFA